MVTKIIVCGSNCGHNHDSVNGPTGCCEKHGPYLYFCQECHDIWTQANPERVAEIRRLANKSRGQGEGS